MPNAMYLDPWLFLALLVAGVYGAERLFVDLVRFVDRRTRPRKKPSPPSPIIRP